MYNRRLYCCYYFARYTAHTHTNTLARRTSVKHTNDRTIGIWNIGKCSEHTHSSLYSIRYAYTIHVMFCQMSAKICHLLSSVGVCLALATIRSHSTATHSRLVRDIPIVSHHHHSWCVCVYKGASNFSPNLPSHFNWMPFYFTSALCMPWFYNWFQKSWLHQHSFRSMCNWILTYGREISKNQID